MQAKVKMEVKMEKIKSKKLNKNEMKIFSIMNRIVDILNKSEITNESFYQGETLLNSNFSIILTKKIRDMTTSSDQNQVYFYIDKKKSKDGRTNIFYLKRCEDSRNTTEVE